MNMWYIFTLWRHYFGTTVPKSRDTWEDSVNINAVSQ